VPSGPGLRRQARRVGGGSGVNGIRRRRIRSAAYKTSCPLRGSRGWMKLPSGSDFDPQGATLAVGGRAPHPGLAARHHSDCRDHALL